jgi:hypothetical protein
MSKWYFSREGKAEGPVDEAFLLDALRTGTLSLIDLVFRTGDDHWRTLGEVEEFRTAFERKPLPPPEAERAPSVDAIWVILQGTELNGDKKTRFEQRGPFSTEQVLQMLAAGQLTFKDYAWREGYQRWARVGNVREFDRRERTGQRPEDRIVNEIPLPFVQSLNRVSAEELLKNVVRVPKSIPGKERLSDEPIANPLQKLTADLTASRETAPLSGAPQPAVSKEDLLEKAAQPIASEAPVKISVKMPIKPAAKQAEAKPVVSEIKPLEKKKTEPIAVVANLQSPPMATESISEIPEVQLSEMAPRPQMQIRRWMFLFLFMVGVAITCVAMIIFMDDEGKILKKTSALIDKNPIYLQAPAPNQAQTPEASAANPPVAMPDPNMKKAENSDGMESQVPGAEKNQNHTSGTSAASVPSEKPQAPPTAHPNQPATQLEMSFAQMTTNPQITVQTNAEIGAEVHLQLKAKSGKILRFVSYQKDLSMRKSASGAVTFDLSKMSLPAGTYRAEISVDQLKKNKVFFLGTHDKAFDLALEKHLKAVSYEQQREKKALFYSARQYQILAQELSQSYNTNKSQIPGWRSFYREWIKKYKKAATPLIAKLQPDTVNSFAYPDEFASLKDATRRLKDQAQSFNEAVEQKRAVANDGGPAGLVKEFAKLKAQAAQISSRQ